jgi:hypothetical protein
VAAEGSGFTDTPLAKMRRLGIAPILGLVHHGSGPDWTSLLTRDYGHYKPGVFDVRSVPPRPTALAGLLRELSAGRAPAQANLLAAQGPPFAQTCNCKVVGSAELPRQAVTHNG